MIDKNKVEIILFGVLSGAVVALMLFIFRPFFTALFLAATFSIVLFPLYKKIRTYSGGREAISALLSILIGLIFVMIPFAFLGQEAFDQAHELYMRLSTNDVSELDYLTNIIEGSVRIFMAEFTLNINQYVEYALGWVTDNFKDVL